MWSRAVRVVDLAGRQVKSSPQSASLEQALSVQ
jgi:hypothetical protein